MAVNSKRTGFQIIRDIIRFLSWVDCVVCLVLAYMFTASGIKYGHEDNWTYESKPVEVKYKTYFAGIHKIDGDTEEDLAGVKLELKENGVAFNARKAADGNYYIPDTAETGATNVVETDSEGRILIRGLDEDKVYTLTETETLPGYNMLTTDITLTEYEDTVTVTKTDVDGTETTTTTNSFDDTKTNEKWGVVENNKGSILPSTGGIGTTMFYIIGAALVLGAGILLVTKRKMAVE